MPAKAVPGEPRAGGRGGSAVGPRGPGGSPGARDTLVRMAERPFPTWIEPMAATPTHERFAGPEWVFGRKLDGVRLLAFKRGDAVRLLSRNRLEQNERYPSLVEAVARLAPGELVLDGEATSVWAGQQPAGYHVFDVLWLEGHDLTSLPLEQRRAQLERLALAPP